jgi:nucleotide-binding universal stress UspA family protein
MVGKVLFVVDGSMPSSEAAGLARDLLPRASDAVVLQVVPQLPHAWTAWPAFPDPGEDLAKASVYVSEVAAGLEARGWRVHTKVHFSVLSAAEMDQEILKLAEGIRPDLICVALAQRGAAASIVRETTVPVLVGKPSAPAEGITGHRRRRRESLEAALAHRALLLNPSAALVFRHAGIL